MDIINYTLEELELISLYSHLPQKECKKCKKDFPINEVFFLREKRCKDGFENSCRMCRVGKYLINNNLENNRGGVLINKSLTDKFKSVQEIYENFMITNSLPNRSFIKDNHKEIFTYIIEKENIPLDELYKLGRDWFKDKRLYSSLLTIYNGKITDYINTVYPKLFNPWERITVGKEYWNKKENRLYALNWLVEQLMKDKIINTIEDIPRNVNGTHFQQYSLGGLLIEYYGHVYHAFNELYPNKFYMWQYCNSSDGYFDDKDNRMNSLKQLIEQYLKVNIQDIPRILSYEYFNTHCQDRNIMKFKSIIDKYYNSLYEYVNEVYPNVFNPRDLPYKNHYPTLDNNIVRSEPERQIHHLFMRNGLNYKYGDDVGKMNIEGVNVLPDWYIYHNDKIYLIEYYGMLDMYGVDFGYTDRYERKEELYNSMCNDDNKYVYVALHKDDMKDNYKGIRDKLSTYGIILGAA